jgi:hypothetical protein
MGILTRKIKATTLMETLVATCIIIIVFVIASLILNNTFRSIAQRDAFSVSNRVEKLMYLYRNDKVSLPYEESTKDYELTLERVTVEGIKYIQIETKLPAQERPVSTYVIDEK